eukprot:COSAG06_NODE_7921_length_2333_cov_2.379141_3_plen_82_part_01
MLAFLSAVLSGAAGAYICTVSEDALISTDVSIHPDMRVHISGDTSLPVAPTWGEGSIEVSNHGVLSVTYVQLGGGIRVAPGG